MESCCGDMKTKVEAALAKIRPMLQRDGGDIQLVGLVGKKVQVKLKGACAGCPGARMTLQMGVQKVLKQEVPDVEGVEAV